MYTTSRAHTCTYVDTAHAERVLLWNPVLGHPSTGILVGTEACQSRQPAFLSRQTLILPPERRRCSEEHTGYMRVFVCACMSVYVYLYRQTYIGHT